MHVTEQLVAALALVAAVSAAPLSETSEKRSGMLSGSKQFSVVQTQPKTPGKKTAGPIALARAIGKYSKVGATVPEKVKTAAVAAAGSDDGTVTASPEEYDQAYLEPVTIGGQSFNLDFDTGSSDLWVFSDELPASEQSGHDLYTPGASATELTGETWSISYGDGSSASGNVYDDTVDCGGTTVTSQAVELASSVSSEFQSDPADGLLGLGFSSINTVTPDQQQTFFSNAESSLDAPLFAVDLKKGAVGSYDFGFIDDSKYTGSITYVPVDNSQGFWGFTADGYAVGSGETTSESITSIADTGTSLLLVQDDVVSAYYGAVDGATDSEEDGGYVFPCTTTLPDLTLVIGGYSAVVPGSYVNYAPASASGSCFGGVQSSAGVGFSIFGDVFLKSQFVVFDDASGGPQLGFAAKDL